MSSESDSRAGRIVIVIFVHLSVREYSELRLSLPAGEGKPVRLEPERAAHIVITTVRQTHYLVEGGQSMPQY
jgi:hypothetical protein